MGLTAWAQEQQAKHDAWREINELKRQNAALVAERDYFKNGMAELQDIIDKLEPERDALVALLDKIKFITPEMLRAAQVRSELGAYACSELSGAYSLISEIYTVMVGEFMKQTTPLQCLREIQAEAGRAGFVACWDWMNTVDILYTPFNTAADKYAEKVRNGE